MIHCTMYVDGTIRDDLPFAEISEILPNPKNHVWCDIEGDAREHVAFLKEEFGFHDLALEDCVKAGQRTKVDEYPGYYFLVFYSPYWDEATQQACAHELHCFVGANYVVTVHHAPIPALAIARQRWRHNPAMLQEGVGYLVYTLMDSIVDEYFPQLDRMEELIEATEVQVMDNPQKAVLNQIFRLKKNLIFLRKVLAPKRDIFNILSRRDQPFFTAQTQFYFRDVFDHLLRILEQVDAHREMTASLLDAYLSGISNQLNAVMKTLTVMATVLMTLSLIAGIYGMNFKYMPELKWPYGYPMVIIGMGIIGAVMTWLFRRKNWF